MYSMNHGSMTNSRKRRNEDDHYEKCALAQGALTQPPTLTHMSSNASLHSQFGQGFDVVMETADEHGEMELDSPGNSPSPEVRTEVRAGKRQQKEALDGYGHVMTMAHLHGRQESGTPSLVDATCQQCEKPLAQDEIYPHDNYTCISCSSVVCRRCSISSIYRADLYCLGCYSHGC